jgi:hypothetical protein
LILSLIVTLPALLLPPRNTVRGIAPIELKAGKSATGRRLQTALCAQKRKRMFNKRLTGKPQFCSDAHQKSQKKEPQKTALKSLTGRRQTERQAPLRLNPENPNEDSKDM